MAERLIGGGSYVNETADRQALVGGSAYLIDATVADTSVALTGVAGTVAVGTPAVATAVVPAGVSGTGAAGSPTASNDRGFLYWAELELPTPESGGSISASLTGVAATGSLGTLSPSTSESTRGYLLWAEIEVPNPPSTGSVTVALPGVEAVTAAGGLGRSVSKGIAGVGAAGAAGTLGAYEGTLVALSGVGATGAAGTLQPVEALTGVEATGAVGSLNVSLIETVGAIGIVVPLTGVGVSGQVASGLAGDVTPISEGPPGGTLTVGLLGVSTTGAAASFGIGAEIVVPGVVVATELHEFFRPEPEVPTVPVDPPFVPRGGGASGRTRVQTTTRFKPLGPRVQLDVPPEDNWPDIVVPDAIAPPPPAPPPQPRVARAPLALPARGQLPALTRPQVAPAPPPPTPGQAANALLATLNELAIAAGLDADAIAELQSIDAIDVSDVFNDMR